MSIAEAVASGCIAGSSSPSLAINVPTPPYLQGGVSRPCLTASAELFFPMDYSLTFRDQIDEAKALCRSCPVADLCLAWATPQASLDGIWGGCTPPERRRLRTSKGRSA